MAYARIVDGIVAELFTPPDGLTPSDCFHADVAAQFALVPDGVSPAQGWTATLSGDAWSFAAPSAPAVTWDQALATRIADGLALTSTGTSALNATYALDATTLDQVGAVARDAASGLGLPGGASSFTYPDAAGAPHSFTEAQIIALYKAMRDLLLSLNTQAAAMKRGDTPSWPAQAATIA